MWEDFALRNGSADGLSARRMPMAGCLHRLGLTAGAFVALSVASPSWAQAPAAVAQDDQPIQEVTVTARRRNERLEDVPLAVAAFSPEALEEKHIVGAADLATFSPSMVVGSYNSNSDSPTFAVRGQATTQFGAPGVIAYFAEVPVSFFGLSAIDGRPGTYYDLQNVQVLNGPQGTLFGKNATGGSVLFVPQKPSDSFGGYAQIEGGNFADERVQGAVNVPVVDGKLLVRFAGEVDRRDGYVTDTGPYFPGKDYNNVHDESARLSIVFRPIDDLENYTILRYYNEDTHGPGDYLAAVNPAASSGALAAFYPGALGYPAVAAANGPYHTSYALDQRDRYRYWQAINTTTYNVTDALMLKNIISYAQYREGLTYSLDGTPYPLFQIITPSGQWDNAPDLFTEEMQIQGKALDEALSFSVGGYYDRQSNASPSFTSNLLPLNILFNGGCGSGPAFQFQPCTSAPAPLATIGYFESTSHAAFAQGTYDVGKTVAALDGLSVTAGYRYTWESVTSNYFLAQVPDQGPAVNTNDFGYGSYTFGLDYKLSKNVMTYVDVRSASKSGGSNLYQPDGSPYLNFRPEKLRDVEVGFKSELDLGSVHNRANLAAYHGDYSNIQRTVNVTYQGVPAFLTLNSADATVQGVEFDDEITPIRNLSFSLSYAYIDSAYDRTSTIAGTTLGLGTFPYTPRNKITLGVTKTVPLSDTVGMLRFNASYTYQTKESPTDTFPSYVQSIPGHGLVNLHGSWLDVMNQGVDIAVFATNLGNDKYIASVNDAYYKPYGTVSELYGEPRMYGVQLTYHFGE